MFAMRGADDDAGVRVKLAQPTDEGSAARAYGPGMSVDETLRAVDGALGPEPGRFLASDVELHEVEAQQTYRGREAVVTRLRQLLEAREDVRLTVDEGRGVAEWVYRARGVAVPMVCVFEIEGGTVRRARLYYDPRALVSVQMGRGKETSAGGEEE